jgi:hypothetical protein
MSKCNFWKWKHRSEMGGDMKRECALSQKGRQIIPRRGFRVKHGRLVQEILLLGNELWLLQKRKITCILLSSLVYLEKKMVHGMESGVI